MQSKKKTQQVGMTALYCRLSRDDGTDSESNSVANQRRLLSQKAKEMGLDNTRFYVDDGYTGTNFNRPGFQSMLDDIDMGYISTVMVKDLSRLGRDYVSVGYYTDQYFPERNIRFNKSIHYFSCSNYVKDTRGECLKRHYIRADSLEQVVILELRRMAAMLRADEERFADILAQKTNRDILNEKKTAEAELQRAITRNEAVMKLYEKLYEDNASGKVTDEWFMSLSHKYEVERMELKEKIAELRKRLDDMDNCQQGREAFLNAIRKFMEMGTLTAPLLHELIDHIVVHETEGTGKNRTQRVEIFYRFVGYIVIPDDYFCGNYVANTRQGVAVKYIPTMSA